jgi:hypothetical protein
VPECGWEGDDMLQQENRMKINAALEKAYLVEIGYGGQ